MRVRGVMAPITASVGKLRSPWPDADGRGGRRPVEFGYGSNAGVGTIVSASCMRAFEMWPMAAIRMLRQPPLVSSTHSGSTPKYFRIVSTRPGYEG